MIQQSGLCLRYALLIYVLTKYAHRLIMELYRQIMQVNVMALTAKDLVQAAKAVIDEVSVEEAQDMIANNCLVLDVRELSEYDAGHIAHAKHISRGMLEFKIIGYPEFEDLTQAILVYCKTGGRSALATETLMKLGFTNAHSMLGGFDTWLETHTPSET